MRIAPQHAYKEADYSPACAWPEDTYVQWGGQGVVLGPKPYRTAFFEAFPTDKENVGGFIRGEGASIAEAEAAAFVKFERQSGCDHLWGREHYTNGGQLCRRCRAFRSGFLPPVVCLGHMRRPVERYELSLCGVDPEDPKSTPRTRYGRQIQIRARLFGIQETPPP